MFRASSFTGTLANSTPVKVFIANMIPVTLWLHSTSNVGRKIEISVDGTTYEEVVYEINALNANAVTYQKRTSLFSGVSHVRYTGAAGDTYGAI